MDLVVNEWLLEYHLPTALPEERRTLSAFLAKLLSTEGRIVVGRVTPFTAKYYRFMKQHSHDPDFKRQFGRLKQLLFRDSTRTLIVDPEETSSVPDDTMIGIHGSDRYLLELAATVSQSMIVTTDQRLIDAVSAKGAYPIVHVRDYVATRSYGPDRAS